MKRRAAIALGALGVLLMLPGLLWLGYLAYVQITLNLSPASAAVIQTDQGETRLGVYQDGDQVLPSPSGAAAPDPTAGPAPTPTAGAPASHGVPPVPTATPAPVRPIRAPTRLRIAKIGVDAPIVLADNDSLPRAKAIGWFFGTGYPGFRGNMVLFGHLNGDYETFARLDELKAGDEVLVQAIDRQYKYVIAGSKVVTKDAVEVLAPTADYRITLLTCTGDFIPATRDYTHRLIVTGFLVE